MADEGEVAARQEGAVATQRWTGTQRLALSLLIAAGLVNFLDRSSLSIALGSVRAELHLSATQIGSLLSAFSLTYGILQLPIGPLLDRAGAWRVMGAGLGVWSLAQTLTGGVSGMRGFLALRSMLGAGESPFFPAGVKLVRTQFPAEHRGRAMGLVNLSTTLGQGIAPPLLTALMLALGWRHMFMLIGCIGLLLAMVWFAVEKRMRPRTEDAKATPISFAAWRSLFARRAMWGMMLGFGGVNYCAWFYIAWLPTYLQTARGVSIARSGWLAAVPFLAGSAGMYLSGLVSDLRVKRGASARTVHLTQIVAGMLVSACFTYAAAQVDSVAAAMACISSALFTIHFAGTSAWGYVQAVSEKSMVASVSSIQNFGSFVIASVGPYVTGRLLDVTHSFTSAFVLCAAVSGTGAVSYLALVRGGSLPQTETA